MRAAECAGPVLSPMTLQLFFGAICGQKRKLETRKWYLDRPAFCFPILKVACVRFLQAKKAVNALWIQAIDIKYPGQ
jgi:hypothetical protein